MRESASGVESSKYAASSFHALSRPVESIENVNPLEWSGFLSSLREPRERGKLRERESSESVLDYWRTYASRLYALFLQSDAARKREDSRETR